jgi:hypothetical protein
MATNSSEPMTRRCGALEALQEVVEAIDNARDLEKLGGIHTLVALLADTEKDVRRAAAWVVGAAAQNNPEVQGRVRGSYIGVGSCFCMTNAFSLKLFRLRAWTTCPGVSLVSAYGHVSILEPCTRFQPNMTLQIWPGQETRTKSLVDGKASTFWYSHTTNMMSPTFRALLASQARVLNSVVSSFEEKSAGVRPGEEVLLLFLCFFLTPILSRVFLSVLLMVGDSDPLAEFVEVTSMNLRSMAKAAKDDCCCIQQPQLPQRQ